MRRLLPLLALLGILAGPSVAHADHYDAFGHRNACGTSDPLTNQRGFQARPFDPGIGLQDSRNRMYDPETGRFAQWDRVEDAGSWGNPFNFADCEPVNRTDPRGSDYVTSDNGGNVWWVIERDGWGPFNSDTRRVNIGFRGVSKDVFGGIYFTDRVNLYREFGGGWVSLKELQDKADKFWERPEAQRSVVSKPDISSWKPADQDWAIKTFINRYLNPHGEHRLSAPGPMLVGRYEKDVDALQTGLDAGGMVPIYGEPLDAANAVIYGFRGKWTDCGLSALGAVPVVGNFATGAKWGRRAVKAVDAAATAGKSADKAATALKMAREGANVAESGLELVQKGRRARGTTVAAATLIELAVNERHGRRILWAMEGSQRLADLERAGAWAAVRANADGRLLDMILRTDVRKIELLEEFLHFTQQKRGIIDRIGKAAAERQVKEFMIRHADLLDLSTGDVRALQQMLEALQ